MLSQEAPQAKQTRLRDHLLQRIVTGCYPELLQRSNERCSTAWSQQYISTLIQRDIQDLTHIDHPELMTQLLKLTAFYAGKLINISDLSNKVGLDRPTIKKYLALLEQLFLVEQLPAWHSNAGYYTASSNAQAFEQKAYAASCGEFNPKRLKIQPFCILKMMPLQESSYRSI